MRLTPERIARMIDLSAVKAQDTEQDVWRMAETALAFGCDLAVKGGAAFAKTGTGWAETGATLENVTLIKARLGGRAGIKAAGGVRGLETLLEMARRGVSRFGLGWRTATEILNRVRSLPGGAVEI